MDTYELACGITERLYGGDKVKFEIIFYLLNFLKKVNDIHGVQDYDELTKSLSEGNLDRYTMGMIEFLEDSFELGKEVANEFIRIFKKVVEICGDENVLHLTDINK